MTEKSIKSLLQNIVQDNYRISREEAIELYKNADFNDLLLFANKIKQQKTGRVVYYIQNYHIEYTNLCELRCRFCAYSTTDIKKSWRLDFDEIIDRVKNLDNDIKELHIVGGSNEEYNICFFEKLFQEIKKIKPYIHIKALTASEIYYLSKIENITTKEVLIRLKNSGLDSLPGGGAEILNDEIRKIICPNKINTTTWLEIHKEAHNSGLPTGATMLYGHIETIENRIEHLELLRTLQDETRGFQVFVPLKFRNKNNELSNIKETNIIEDLKIFAISRIFLDNFKHIKVYWPAYGKNFAQLALNAGADDLDGTIHNSTRIYSSAGAEDVNPCLSKNEAIYLIKEAGYTPIERDAMFNLI